MSYVQQNRGYRCLLFNMDIGQKIGSVTFSSSYVRNPSIHKCNVLCSVIFNLDLAYSKLPSSSKNRTVSCTEN